MVIIMFLRYIRCVLLSIVVLLIIGFVCCVCYADGHSENIVVKAVGDECSWGVENDTLYIWPNDGVRGVLPSNSNNTSYFWPWLSGFKYVYVEPGVVGNTNLSYLFYSKNACVSIDASNLDVSGVVSMSNLFRECRNLVSVNVSGWNTSNVTDMSRMFTYCACENLDLSDFDTSNVTNMSEMFDSCYYLRRLDISGFDMRNVSYYLSNMFCSSGRLEEVVLGPNFSFKARISSSASWAKLPDGLWENSSLGLQYTASELQNGYNGTMCGTWKLAHNGQTSGGVSWEYDANTDVLRIFPTNGVSGVLTYSNSSVPWYGIRSLPKHVVVEGVVYAQSTYCMFSGFSNMEDIDLSGISTVGSMNMSGMFNQCSKLVTLDISGFDTSSVTDMSSMFAHCSKLVSLDISNFDTSNVRNMGSMFSYCRSLENVSFPSVFDTSRVTNMYQMFSNCDVLDHLNISSWDFSSVTSINGMFSGCYGLCDFSAVGLSFDSATSFYELFEYCRSFETLDLSSWNAPLVSTMDYCFQGCNSLVTLDISCFSNSPIRSIQSCFRDCSSLASIVGIDSFGNQVFSNMPRVFDGCSSLTSLDLSSWDVTDCYNFSYMFNGCSSLVSLNLKDWVVTHSVYGANLEYMFRNCSSLTSLDISGWNGDYIYSASYTFSGCRSLKELDLLGWNTSRSSVKYLFDSCSSLECIKLGLHFDFMGSSSNVYDRANIPVQYDYWKRDDDTVRYTSSDLVSLWNGATMAGVYRLDKRYVVFFSNGDMVFCDKTYFDFGDPNILAYFTDFEFYRSSGVTESSWSSYRSLVKRVIFESELSPVGVVSWFKGMVNLVSIENIEYLNTSGVTSLYDLFLNCRSLESLDLSNFDTSNVRNMQSVFGGCNSLSSVVLGRDFSFLGNGSISSSYTALLPTPSGADYTGKWIRDDGEYGPYTPVELRDNYDGSLMAGTWVLEESFFMLSLVPPEAETDSYGGSMEPHKYDPTVVNRIPWNGYYRFGYKFDHWTDGTYEYENGDSIPANRYSLGDRITLTAVFEEVDTSVDLVEGVFDLYLSGGESALLNEVPGNVQYQVYEETLSGWQLVKQGNTDGSILNGNAYVVFENRYDPDKVVVQFIGQKKVVNDDSDVSYPSEGMYEFVLTDITDNVIIQTVGNSDGGLIVFDPIEFVSACEKVYEIREISGSDSEITYDDHVERVTVTVSNFGDELTSNVDIDDDGIVFTNRIHIPCVQTGALSLSKQALSSSGSSYWFPGQVFRFEIKFYNERHAVPDEVCASYLSEVASANGWYYDVSTGILHLNLTQQTPSVTIDNIPMSLYYEVAEVDAS